MINNTLFRPSVIRAARQKFNPEGFDLAKAIKRRKIALNAPPPPEKKEPGESHINAFSDCQPIELIEPSSEAERELVIEATYKQVFGNAHLMESERFPQIESQFRRGQITVLEFVRQLAKSDRYRVLFFERCTNLRAIELNFKHLLGRAPENYAEISEHIKILAEGGFAAEIDSYLDSDEYCQSFGENIVPYYRGYQTKTGKNLAGFTHSFQLLRGASSSDKSILSSSSPQLQEALLDDKPTKIEPLSRGLTPVPKKSPVKSVEYKFTDLEISGYKYKSPEYLATPVSPNTWLQQYKAREAAATFPAARESQPVKLFDGAFGEELEIVIRAAYKQVFGNVHLMESQRLLTAESKLKDGQFTVKDFIRELAQSDLYRSLFFETCANVRAIELNFKHLLGRAPDSFQEVSEHIAILAEKGLAGEIDSYLDSEEYEENFGKDTVPYYVSYETQTGKNVAGYNRIFQLIKGQSSSDRSIASSIESSKSSQLEQSLLKKPETKKEPIVFNPKGFNLAKELGVGTYKQEPRIQEPTISDPYIKAFADSKPIELFTGDSFEKQQLVIEAAYKQVFGNAHLMESERLPEIESQLCSGRITVMEFVRQLAKSERYRALFWEKYPNLRVIELNFKHLLGRAPENYTEISQHISILAEGGFEAEIDSYLNSDEYCQTFGENIVPYYRGYETQTGKNLTGFTHSFQLLRGASSSDKSISRNTYAELDRTLLSDIPNQITDFSEDSNAKDLTSQSVESQVTESQEIPPSEYPVYNGTSVSQRAIICQNEYKAVVDSPIKFKFVPNSSFEDVELVIRALYKQVLGNAHVMESERLTVAESQLKHGHITVREFVRCLAKSELYKSRFIDNCPRYRCHELNFKHLLGRAPDSYQETVYHSQILDSQGYEADIDSYIDSQEYEEAFGENIVPYYRGYKTQTGKSVVGYTYMFEMFESLSTSDQASFSGNQSRLQNQLMSNNPVNASQPITDTVELVRKVLKASSGNQSRLQNQLMSNNPNTFQPVNDTVQLVRKVLNLV
ncbi:MAG: phycobilisome Linker polypeptide [Okeania sp. SIO3B5]|uniref:phycobilisome rod-core linker polypeptide n=1 Tax=Okeania sp. SIO3B5 TaxID=2607811 RepID=UPI001400ED2D|nr:phycobilisome rod-core linker polypeptide [Okeania sp. SIO3B5]NEO56323.1 phycobilisome Linker polypeptide [Okeania sp. SIO3B5]